MIVSATIPRTKDEITSNTKNIFSSGLTRVLSLCITHNIKIMALIINVITISEYG